MTFQRAAFAAITILNSASLTMLAQGVTPAGRGGRGIPGATPEQIAAVTQLSAGLATPAKRLTDARTEVIAAALAQPRNDAALKVKIEAVRSDELALANSLSNSFAKLQASPNKLEAAQISAAALFVGAPFGGRGGAGAAYRTSMPHVTAKQAIALADMTSSLTAQSQALAAARADVIQAALAVPPNDVAIQATIDAVAKAELALASARADALATFQSTSNKLDAEQLDWLIAGGGSYGQGGFTEPEPMNFGDHRGYISLFDGVSLKGWDGNPKFWHVEDGAIVGESTPENPSGNTYIAYRGVEAKDFTLKFEMKVEGTGGSGFQYRSKTGIPWSRPIPANVTANVGPVNLNWMMTGPQADFWPSRIYTGQFYSENTPMGIMAFRGEVVEGAGLGAKRLMGNIGDRAALGTLVKANDWNEYTVIARGGTFIHIVNGQLMAVMVDDDPDSSNNQSGIFGIEIEATTKVSTRNIWLKKLN
jgi:Domain of Unknown Function (DUF1080)